MSTKFGKAAICMVNLSFAEVVAATGGEVVAVNPELEQLRINGVVTDNRKISGGELFIAIAGEKVDGNTFAGAALTAGASAVLTQDAKTALASGAKAEQIIVVKDVIFALGKLAKFWLAYVRKHTTVDLKVIGITGSVGKTTTKDLLARLLLYRGAVVAPPNSFNNEIGLALTVLRADLDTASLVLEMGADRAGNIEYLTNIAPLDVSVVLAVAKAHLGNFGSLENTINEKSQIIAGTLDTGVTILNADDPHILKMADKASCRVEFFSAQNAQVSGKNKELQSVFAVATNISNTAEHPSFRLQIGAKKEEVTLGLVGRHNIMNALAATAVAQILGIDFADIVHELAVAKPASPHRMDVRKIEQRLIIDDAYNANPASMRAGIEALGVLGAQYTRRIAVLGQMLELGAESAKEHAALLAPLNAARVTDLFLVGEGAFVLANVAQEAGINVVKYFSVDSLLAELEQLLPPQCAVLFKGSNSTRVWQAAENLFTKGCTK